MQGLAKYVSSSPDLDRNFSMAFEPCPGIHHLFLYAKYRIIMHVVTPLDKMVLH